MTSRITYTLRDTFNQRTISRHFSVAAAVAAQQAHLRAVRRANGRNSYLTYEIVASDGRDLWDEIEQIKIGFAQQAAVGVWFTADELDAAAQ